MTEQEKSIAYGATLRRAVTDASHAYAMALARQADAVTAEVAAYVDVESRLITPAGVDRATHVHYRLAVDAARVAEEESAGRREGLHEASRMLATFMVAFLKAEVKP